MTKQAEALRIAARFLRLQSMGAETSPKDSKIISDLCYLALPMKYRLSKQDLVNLEMEARTGISVL